MGMRRFLVEAAYDFWARDQRDGETGPMRDTLAEARADVRRIRSTLEHWKRPAIELRWAVNERKVLRLLEAGESAAASPPAPRTRKPDSRKLVES